MVHSSVSKQLRIMLTAPNRSLVPECLSQGALPHKYLLYSCQCALRYISRYRIRDVTAAYFVAVKKPGETKRKETCGFCKAGFGIFLEGMMEWWSSTDGVRETVSGHGEGEERNSRILRKLKFRLRRPVLTCMMGRPQAESLDLFPGCNFHRDSFWKPCCFFFRGRLQ